MIDYDSKSFARILLQIRGSVIPNIASRIVLCAGIGAGAAYLHETRGVKIPSIAHTLLGVALGLLLVFRTNASYDRYWEGRRLLGSFVNRARDLARQAVSFVEGDDAIGRAHRQEIVQKTVLLYALLRQYLRKERELENLGVPLRDEEKEALREAVVRPCLAVHWMTAAMVKAQADGRLSEEKLRLMDNNITSFLDAWGGAERIMKTPIPFAYAQHIKSFLTLFCLSAPFAMVESMKWSTPIAAGILAFGMFGIDEIGVEIEDPFGYDPNDLPLDAIGNRVDADLALLLAQRDPPVKNDVDID
ncbi:MAG: bestrophin family ion channel [Byssovorax sp.]